MISLLKPACLFRLRSLSLSCLLLSASATPGAAADRLSVVTSSTGLLYATVYIAQELGFFAREGLDVRVYDGTGGSNAVAALVGGSADIGSIGIRNITQAVVNGQELKVIATGSRGFPNNMVVRRDIAAAANLEQAAIAERARLLKGKTIAVSDIGGSSGDFVRDLLATAGLTPDDATIINITGGTAALALLRAKRIDAALLGSPYSEIAVADGSGSLLISGNRDLPEVAGVEYVVHAVRADVLQKKAGVIERYLRAIRTAQVSVVERPADAEKAFFAFLEREGGGAAFDAAIRSATWASTVPGIPRTLVIGETEMLASRRFFKIPDKVTDARLLDLTVARKIMGEK